MPAIQRETAVLTATTNPNLLAGSVFEFARRNALLVASCLATATGAFITINAGSDVVLEESPPFVLAGAGVYGVIPDHFYYNAVAQQGDRIVIAARNPTGGTITFKTIVQITYV